MARCHKTSWISVLFIGVFFLMSSGILAEVLHSSKSSKILECQTALEKFSLRLEERSRGRPNQTYYANLYRQAQDFLTGLKNFSTSSPASSLDKCQNYLNVVQDIVGRHGADLAPLPGYSSRQYGGRLTQSILRTVPKRELRNVRYEYAERVKAAKEKQEIGEEEEDLEELPFAPSPTRRSSKTGNHLTPETKDYEPKF
jgi:hypothetical protein